MCLLNPVSNLTAFSAFLCPLLYCNPFSYQTWCFQDALFYGRLAHPWAWVVFTALSLLALALGYRTFIKLKPFFGNVL
jgi:lipopolysaccharide transport system permease protein